MTKKRRTRGRMEGSMNNFGKRSKLLFVFLLSVIMLLVTGVPTLAAGEGEPLIKISIDPFAVIMVIAGFILVAVLLIAALISINKKISGARTRVKRLSKIETEETVQLYDELNEAKWDENETAGETPRKVLLEDDFAKSKDPSVSASKSPDSADSEPHRHGPVPERDMPGYVPPTNEPQPQTSGYTPVATQTAAPAGRPSPTMQSQPQYAPPYSSAPSQPPYAQGPYAYPTADMQPRVYRPDSDVEIIMRDDPTLAKSTADTPISVTYSTDEATETLAAASAPKVRAYRRRGKAPSLITGAAAASVASDTAPEIVPEIPTEDKYEGIYIPNTNFRHMSIFPNARPVYSDGYSTAPEEAEAPVACTLEVNTAPAPAVEEPVVPSAPVLEPGEENADGEIDAVITRERVDSDEIATVEVIPPRRGVNDKVVVRLGDDIVDGKLMRTLEDVIEELDDGPVIEIEAAMDPVYEEELVFLGSDAVTIESDDELSEDDDGEARMFINGEYVLVHYRTSFMSRFIQAEERIQDYYSVVKNILLSYQDVKSRISWSHESFSSGKTSIAKLNVKGKTLVLYLALDPAAYEGTKYRFTNVSDKPKYEKTPMKLKIRSDRALKYALELIVDMMGELGIVHGEMPDIDYRLPYETVDKLIDKGLVKVVLPSGMKLDDDANVVKVDVAEIVEGDTQQNQEPVSAESGTVFEFVDKDPEQPIAEEVIEEPDVEVVEEPVEEVIEEPAEEVIEEPVVEVIEEPVEEVIEEPVLHVNAIEADALVTDEEAVASIEIVEIERKSFSGKVCEVNLDTICNLFDDGETVSIDELKKRKIAPKSAERVKILARGVMTKRLTIIADKFSLQAVKMITLAGGHAEQIK